MRWGLMASIERGAGDMASEKRVSGYETKLCPRCGAELYADMNVCYGCLYDFSRESARPELPGFPEEESERDEGDTLDLGRRASAPGKGTGMLVRTASIDVWVGVPAQGVSVGRAPGNDIVLHSHAVSRSHLRLVPKPEGMEVSDLGATNPARHRGRDVRGSIVVPYGDAVDVCGCVLTMTGPS